MIERNIGSIAVFCGSNAGSTPAFSEGAALLGAALAEADITLVYGGTSKGLMAILADAAIAAGGKVHGVITERLHQSGHSHQGLTTHEILPTLRERKQRMAELADAFIALPGGLGTLEEFMEAWTRNQLGEIDKPVGLLNTAGFFDSFLSFIDHMVDSRFLPPEHRFSLSVDANPRTLIHQLIRFEKTTVPKWL